MTKRLFIESDFEEIERLTFDASRVYRATPGYVYVCTDALGDDVLRTETGRLVEVFKNATAIETEGHEQTD